MKYFKVVYETSRKSDTIVSAATPELAKTRVRRQVISRIRTFHSCVEVSREEALQAKIQERADDHELAKLVGELTLPWLKTGDLQ